jgi:starch phosphorylase
MKRARKRGSPGGDGYTFSAAVSAGRPPEDFTPRVLPHCAGVAVPLEADPILWQR